MKMLTIPDNVRQNLIRLIPSSVVNDISCFVHYDNHPKDNKRIDIIICTKTGEVKEFWQRELVSDIKLACSSPSEIKILRNNACELFYIVLVEDQLIILSRRDCLVIHKMIDNVERYDIDDTLCDGQASLKVIRKDDAVPLIFDDKLESFGDGGLILSNTHVEEPLAILSELNRKLIEAKYSVKCNESIYKEYTNLCQLAAFSMYQKNHPNLEESVFKSGSKEIAGVFNIKTCTPWIRVSNEKIVIVFNILNNNEDVLKNVQILLHVKNGSSLVYTTKLFERIHKSPFWIEKKADTIANNEEVALVTVVPIKEVKDNITSRLDISGIVVYKMDKEHILPFDEISLSALDTMGEKFDVLSCNEIDEFHMILAVLATTEKYELILRHIRKEEEPVLDVPATFCTYLLMERVKNTKNILIHRKSPYHPLNGVMIIFREHYLGKKDCYQISIHTRTPAQVLAFIHYVNDALPYKMLITTANHKITAKTKDHSEYNEDMDSNEPPEVDYLKYATAMLNQTDMLIEHLDICMVKMNETNDPDVQSLIGSQIDIFAAGLHKYEELRKKILNEEIKGLKQLYSNS